MHYRVLRGHAIVTKFAGLIHFTGVANWEVAIPHVSLWGVMRSGLPRGGHVEIPGAAKGLRLKHAREPGKPVKATTTRCSGFLKTYIDAANFPPMAAGCKNPVNRSLTAGKLSLPGLL